MNLQTRLLLHRPLAAAGLLGALLMLAASSSTPNRAPIETQPSPVVAAVPLAAASAATTALPGWRTPAPKTLASRVTTPSSPVTC
jgi:hypothetical protein